MDAVKFVGKTPDRFPIEASGASFYHAVEQSVAVVVDPFDPPAAHYV